MQITSADHVVVTGATGFLGGHLMPVLRERYASARITGVCSRDHDLLDPSAAEAMLDDLQPSVVVHLAAYSGGIGANRAYPADFFHRNLLLTENVFHACAGAGVRKLVYPMGGCSYPATATSPIDEGQMWDGFPVETSAGYSVAKKMGLVAGWAYREQHGLNSTVIVPGNMYGEYDNFSNEDSHVIPGLIRRFWEATRDGLPVVNMWGTGEPTRDFVYAGDVAAVIPWFIEADDCPGPVNISSGTCTSIRDLAEMIASIAGYEGRLEWDTTKPDGQMHKVFSVEKLSALGLSCNTPLEDGLRRTLSWLGANYDTPGAVRL